MRGPPTLDGRLWRPGHRPRQSCHGVPLGTPANVEAAGIGRDDAEGTLQGIDRPDNLGRIAHREHAGGRVDGDDAAGSDQRVLADGDQREQRDVQPDARAAPDGRALHALGADGMRVVADGHARRQEGVVFDRGELGDVDVAVDADAVADAAAVIDGGVVPQRALAADVRLLAHHGVMTGLEVVADFDRGINDRAGAETGAGADARRPGDAWPAGRVAEEDPEINGSVRPQVDLAAYGHAVGVYGSEAGREPGLRRFGYGFGHPVLNRRQRTRNPQRKIETTGSSVRERVPWRF